MKGACNVNKLSQSCCSCSCSCCCCDSCCCCCSCSGNNQRFVKVFTSLAFPFIQTHSHTLPYTLKYSHTHLHTLPHSYTHTQTLLHRNLCVAYLRFYARTTRTSRTCFILHAPKEIVKKMNIYTLYTQVIRLYIQIYILCGYRLSFIAAGDAASVRLRCTLSTER